MEMPLSWNLLSRGLMAMVLLLIAGCAKAPSPTDTTPTRSEPLPIEQDFHAVSTRWTLVRRSATESTMATIASRERAAYLAVGCRNTDTTSATIVLASSGSTYFPEARNLALSFDGGPAIVHPWAPTQFSDTVWGFYTQARAADFRSELEALKTHHEIEAVAKEGGKEIFRQHFSLDGAAETIDAALKQCPLSTEKAPVASDTGWGVVERSTNGNTMVVGVFRPNSHHGIEIFCNENAKRLGIMLWPQEPFEAPAETLTLALAFDGGTPIRQHWNASQVVFDYWDKDPGFSSVINRLRSHRTVTVTMGPAGAEQGETFTLDGAAAAIEKVYAACGK